MRTNNKELLRLPDLPRGAFDQFLRARWHKALELGQVPNAARFLSACRVAFEQLDDTSQWENLAKADEERFEREYRVAMEVRRHAVVKGESKCVSATSVRRDPSSASCSSTSEGSEPPLSALTFTPTSSLDHSFSDMSLVRNAAAPDRASKSLAECGTLSDLAPFVAAVLRDKVVSDLMNDVQTLQAEARDLKHRHRRERISQKALLMVTGGGGPGKKNRPIFAWADRYSNPEELTRVPPKSQWARWQAEDRCKFKELLQGQLVVKGESVGTFADAQHYTVKVVAPGWGQGVGDDIDPEIVFGIALGKHTVEFAARCRVSRDDLLILLGRPDFPSHTDEIEVEQAVELEFLHANIKPESRVRFLWAKKDRRSGKNCRRRRPHKPGGVC